MNTHIFIKHLPEPNQLLHDLDIRHEGERETVSMSVTFQKKNENKSRHG